MSVERPPPPYATDDRQRHFRRGARRSMAIFGPLTVASAVLAAYAGSWLHDGPVGFLAGPWLPYVAALPALPFLAGAIVYVTGRPFGELAAAWDELRGWQRGVVGAIVVLGAAAVILGAVLLALDRFAPMER